MTELAKACVQHTQCGKILYGRRRDRLDGRNHIRVQYRRGQCLGGCARTLAHVADVKARLRNQRGKLCDAVKSSVAWKIYGHAGLCAFVRDPTRIQTQQL